MKLRSYLLIGVVASILPVLIFSVIMLVIYHREQRAAIQRSMLDTARALSLAVDRDLETSISALQSLETSEHIERGDIRRFYEQARRVLISQKHQRQWSTIILFDSGGRQVVNLLRPFGSPLPKDPPSSPGIKNTIDLKRPVVSDLFIGRIPGEARIAVNVPVIRNGEVRYVLGANFPPLSLANLLKKQNIPADWLVTIIDRNEIIIARSHDFDKYFGKPATPTLAAKSKEADEAIWRGTTPEGIEVFSSLKRSDLSGWTVAVGAPVSIINKPLWRSLLVLAGGGLVLLLGGIVLVGFLSRRLAASIYTLSSAAETLIAEDAAAAAAAAAAARAAKITEVAQVAQAIQEAALRRKRAEEEILGLAKFPAENPNPVIRVGLNGTILYANQCSAPILTTWGREVGQNVPDVCQKGIAAAFESGINKEMEIECDGRIFSCILTPILAEGYLNIYGLDTTDKKRAEEEIARQFAELRRWFDVTVDREEQMMKLKREVNELLARLGEPIRYPSKTAGADEPPDSGPAEKT